MKIKHLHIFFILVFFAISGCKPASESTDTPTPITPATPTTPVTPPVYTQTANVYVAGSITDANHIQQAAYWKNATLVILTNGTKTSSATGIAVSGSDVYVTGFVTAANGNSIATYWKNGTAVNLPSNGSNSSCANIVIQGTDVYIEGFVDTYAVYWKNGVQVTLPKPAGTSITSSSDIAVQGTDVYVAGYALLNQGTGSAVVYWKNGTPTILPSSSSAYGGNIIVQGTDLYVGAVYSSATASITDATYWKNGTAVSWGDGTNAINMTAGLALNGSDVYGAGPVRTSSGYLGSVGAYWKNGKATLLTDLNTFCTVAAIKIFNNDVYICGALTPGPVFWKNGVSVSLPTPTTSGGSVQAITITAL